MANTYRIAARDVRAWRRHLEEEGFVVVGGAISAARCAEHLRNMRETLRVLSQGKLSDDPKTWTVAANYPFLLHSGMVQYVGHAPFQWECRADLAPVFASFWGTEALRSSFDGFCYMDASRRYAPRPIDSFLHTDQSPQREGLWSIQGLLNLTDLGPGGGGFVAVPKSHLRHRAYFESTGRMSSFTLQNNWYKFSEQEKQDPRVAGAVVIEAQAGDAILWDSRTFHCNTTPTIPVTRAVVYVCMLPQERVPAHIQVKRRAAFADRRCTSHHPGDGFSCFPRLPRFGHLDPAALAAVQQLRLRPSQEALI